MEINEENVESHLNADLHGLDLHGYMENLGGILENMNFSDFIFHRADYNRRYFKDENTFLVTGHTPTFSIRDDGKAFVYEKNGHIAIDCGCVYGKVDFV